MTDYTVVELGDMELTAAVDLGGTVVSGTTAVVSGPPGRQGDPGADGVDGVDGAPGATGLTGPAGAASSVPGPTGPTGPTGATGPTGPTGADSTVPGPKGDPGDPGTDGVAGVDGADPVWIETEIDFGTDPAWSQQFTVTDPAVAPTSHVAVLGSGKVATGRTGDDWAWDALILTAQPATGSFVLTALAVPGPVVGKRTIQYQIG